MAIQVTQVRVPGAGDVNYASSRVGFVARNDTRALATAAAAAGLRALGNNEYQANDGSWIRMNANGTLDRGAGGVQFQGIPGNTRNQPQQPVARATVNVTVQVGQP